MVLVVVVLSLIITLFHSHPLKPSHQIRRWRHCWTRFEPYSRVGKWTNSGTSA